MLKRVDLTSRTLVALIEPGSCFAGTLAEIVFASDRSYMLIGQLDGDNRPPAVIALADVNFGAYPMPNGISRLQSRFLGNARRARSRARQDRRNVGRASRGGARSRHLRLRRHRLGGRDPHLPGGARELLADGLTGMEANLRFGGPETMESKIFARLTAWQNWIFQRPNAVGEDGALRRYGTGQKPAFDTRRV